VSITNDNPQMQADPFGPAVHKADSLGPSSFKVLTELTANLDTASARASLASASLSPFYRMSQISFLRDRLSKRASVPRNPDLMHFSETINDPLDSLNHAIYIHICPYFNAH